MSAPYNLSNITGSGGLVTLIGNTNALISNIFAIGWLLVVFMVVFMQLKNYYTKNAVFAAAFLTVLNGVGFFLLGWISQSILMMTIVVFAISVVWLFIG